MFRSKAHVAKRRAALFTSSAFVAASLCVGGVALAPSAAFAADECGPGPTVTCAAGNYPAITYNSADSAGDLSITTLGAINAGAGIDIYGSGADNLILNATAGTLMDFSGVDVIHTGSGNINVTAGTIFGGLRASTTGAGAVTLNANTAMIANSTSGKITVTTTTGSVVATSTSGLVDIASTSGMVTATTGSGAINITKSSGAVTATSGTGAINITRGFSTDNATATTGGALTMTLSGAGTLTTNTSSGSANTLITLNSGNTKATNIRTGSGSVTINNGGRMGDSNVNTWDNLVLTGLQGTGELTVNGGELNGRLDLSAYNGAFTRNASASNFGWVTNGLNRLARGANTINNAADSVMTFGYDDASLGIGSGAFGLTTTRLVFQTGVDAFNNAGTMIIGSEPGNGALGATLSIEGLETFNNSGTILLGTKPLTNSGGVATNLVVGQTLTDRGYDDVFSLRDSHFVGLEGSRIYMDAFFNNGGQTGCTRNVDGLPDGVVATRQNGFLAANDCLDFRGTQVSGQTQIVLVDVLPQDRGAYNPDGNVLVDVRGGVVEASDVFVISPDTAGYLAVGNGAIDKGLFAYTLGFDAEETGQGGQFKLYGIEAPTSQQFPLLAQAATELWRVGAASWADRRAAQRNEDRDPALNRRAWLRVSAGSADRVSSYNVMAGDTPLTFDNNHTIDTTSVTIGYDLGRVTVGGGEWVIGALVGYGRAELGYEAIVSTGNIEGIHAGLYSGFTAGPFFQDLVIDAMSVGLENDAPSLGLTPGSACNPDTTQAQYLPECVDDPNARPILDTDIRALGINADTGWRFMVDRVALEPMVSLQWYSAEIDAMNVPAADPTRLGGEVSFDNVSSLRAGLGLRVSIDDLTPGIMPLGVRLTARSMQEWDGQSTVRIVNIGPDPAVIANTFDGNFNELTAGVMLGDGSGHVDGFLNIGGVWGDDYEARTASAGVRLRW